MEKEPQEIKKHWKSKKEQRQREKHWKIIENNWRRGNV
jgi:hypothetical protein